MHGIYHGSYNLPGFKMERKIFLLPNLHEGKKLAGGTNKCWGHKLCKARGHISVNFVSGGSAAKYCKMECHKFLYIPSRIVG